MVKYCKYAFFFLIALPVMSLRHHDDVIDYHLRQKCLFYSKNKQNHIMQQNRMLKSIATVFEVSASSLQLEAASVQACYEDRHRSLSKK